MVTGTSPSLLRKNAGTGPGATSTNPATQTWNEHGVPGASGSTWEPPYLHWGVEQPEVSVERDAVDLGDQRTAEVPVDVPADNASNVMAQVPDNGNVLPPGPYMVFVNRSTDRGPVPSAAAFVSITIGDEGEIVGTEQVEQTAIDEVTSLIGAEAAPVESAPAPATGLAGGSLVALAAAAVVALRRRRAS